MAEILSHGLKVAFMFFGDMNSHHKEWLNQWVKHWSVWLCSVWFFKSMWLSVTCKCSNSSIWVNLENFPNLGSYLTLHRLQYNQWLLGVECAALLFSFDKCSINHSWLFFLLLILDFLGLVHFFNENFFSHFNFTARLI